MLDTQERPDVSEQYEVAGNTSSLKVEARTRGAADVLMSAGMAQQFAGAPPPYSQLRTGMALLRLHSEWSSASVRGQREGRALAQTDLMLLANGLTARAAVWAQLSPWLAMHGMDPEVGALGLFYWVAPTCLPCDGRGLLKVANSPALSGRQCKRCGGTGHRLPPQGTAKVLAFLDESVNRARVALKKRLRPEGV